MVHLLSDVIVTHKQDKNGKLRKIHGYKIERNFTQFLEFCGWTIDDSSGEITHPNYKSLYYDIDEEAFISRQDDDRIIFEMNFYYKEPFKNMYADDETWELIYRVDGFEMRIKLK